ncbi:kinase-like domain-containing protein [Xylaria grammica]|nr:kinase-like domain-containing protein [Xylaria grammica]
MSVHLEESEEPTNPFSEGHVESRLQLPPSLLKRMEEPTNPFSEGHVERRLPLPSALPKERGEEPTNSFSLEEYVERRRLHPPSAPSPGGIHDEIASQMSRRDQGSVPITELEAPNPQCRLLIQPRDPSTFQSEKGRRQHLCRRSASSRHRGTTIECIAVTQDLKRASYLISEPVPCRLFYDSEGDSITIQNCHLQELILIAEVTTAGTSKSTVVGPHKNFIVRPGAWVVSQHASNGLPVFQLMVYPRTYSLSVVNTAKPAMISGSKRKHDGDGKHMKISAPMNLSLSRIISNLGDVKAGELVVVAADGKEEYQIRRLKHTEHNTRNSSVYMAKVSICPQLNVVVKFIKGDSALSRGKAWQQEYDLHKKLDCDVIVPLVGADARFSVIYLKWIRAEDLAHQRWRNNSDHFFLGDEQDAVCILRDMARALSYLGERSIVHHDIKPANILYCTKMGAFLIDFGLGCNENSRPHWGGTPWYVGPEYLSAGGERLAADDVWALGVVMLYLLRLVPLPELGRPGAGWLIKHARDPSLAANKEMREWLSVVQTVTEEKLDEGNQLHNLVKRMLTLNPQLRIKPQDITKELQVQRPKIYQT